MPPTRRQVYVRRRIVVGSAAALVLATGVYLPVTLLAPVPLASSVVVGVEPPPPETPVLTFPPYGASGLGAVGFEGVLASAGTPDALPIASITKVVTALVVLDAHPLAPGELGPAVTMGVQDEQFYAEQVAQDGIVASVTAGQTVTERHMLDLALMASANNYAQSVAAWAFGSEAAYVDAARAWLDRNGLTSTTITDATGIQPTNTSTVSDLIELGKLALASPVVAEIVATSQVEVPGVGTVANRNLLLGIDGVDGIKTGTLDESGACLLFSADHVVDGQPITLVGVVLGGPDHPTIAEAIRGILAEADRGFRRIDLAAVGDVLARYDSVWGDQASAVAAEEASVVTWSATPVTAEVTVDPVRLAEAGAEVGRVTFTVGSRTVIVPLVLDATIDDPGPWWRLSHPAELL